jgi:glycosyltransferase involved in cell wall biosynthesis
MWGSRSANPAMELRSMALSNSGVALRGTSERLSVVTPRRVLHIIDTGGPGGAETILDSVVTHVDREAWVPRVVVPEEDWLSNRLRSRGADFVVVRSRRGVAPGLLIRLIREIREFRPAIVHAHLLGSGVYGSLAAAIAGDIPVVCTFQGRPDVSPDDRLLALKARILSRAKNRIVYVSHDLRAYLEPLLNVPGASGLVIHNGVDFAGPKLTGEERETCGAGPGDLLVGAVGNIRPAKDYETFVRAAGIVCGRRPNVRFVIAGDVRSPLTEPLKRLTAELGIEERLRFLGFRQDASALVASFDVFVSSSTTEGLPLATLEAVGLGKPVVLTRVGGVPEIVDSGRTGLLVPPSDPAALAEGILQLLDDPERASEMARAGAADVRERFSVQRMCGAYESLYDQLLRS